MTSAHMTRQHGGSFITEYWFVGDSFHYPVERSVYNHRRDYGARVVA